MMKENPKLFTSILLVVTTMLYTFGMYINDINSVILHTLEFIILFEIVRALAEFIFSDSKRIKMRYFIDSAFVFALRELYVGLVEIHKGTMTTFTLFGWEFTILLGVLTAILSLATMGALVFIRTKLVKYSPDFFKE